MQTTYQKRRRIRFNVLLTYGVLIVFLLASITPFAYSILRSLLGLQEAFQNPSLFAPRLWDFDNYVTVIRDAPFGRFLVNSTIITLSRVALAVTLRHDGGLCVRYQAL